MLRIVARVLIARQHDCPVLRPLESLMRASMRTSARAPASQDRWRERASSPQLKVCNLSFNELSAWRSNTCVAVPPKVAGLPSLSLPLALQLAVL
jgi:hypothetical protein